VRSLSRAGIGLGTTIENPQCTITQRPEHCTTHNERYCGQRTGNFGQVLRRTTGGAASNGLSRCQGLLVCPFTTTSALHSPCLVRISFANKRNSTAKSWGFGAQCLCVVPELSLCVHFENSHEHTLSFSSAAEYSYILKQKTRIT
jgi:hypothetical protein